MTGAGDGAEDGAYSDDAKVKDCQPAMSHPSGRYLLNPCQGRNISDPNLPRRVTGNGSLQAWGGAEGFRPAHPEVEPLGGLGKDRS